MHTIFYLRESSAYKEALSIYTQQEKNASPGDELVYLDPKLNKFEIVTTGERDLHQVIEAMPRSSMLVIYSTSELKEIRLAKEAFEKKRTSNICIRILRPNLSLRPNEKQSLAVLQSLQDFEERAPLVKDTDSKKPQVFGNLPLSDELIEKIKDERRKGHTIREIAKILGVSKTSASKYAKGIKPVDRKEAKRLLETHVEKKEKKPPRSFEGLKKDDPLSQYMEKFIDWQREDSTKNTYRSDLARFIRYIFVTGQIVTDPNDLTEAHAQGYLNWLTDTKYKNTTIHRAFTVNQNFMKFCIDRGLAKSNPFKLVKLPRRETMKVKAEPLSKDELKKILLHLHGKIAAASDVPERETAYKVFIGVYLLASVGMRISALRALTVSSIKSIRGITALELIRKKGSPYRNTIDRKTEKLLNEYIDFYVTSDGELSPPENTKLFYESRENKTIAVGRTFFNDHLRAIAKELGIRKTITTHDLRATYATLNVDKGMAPEELQRRMGHKKIEQTLSYVKLAEKPPEDSILDDLDFDGEL